MLPVEWPMAFTTRQRFVQLLLEPFWGGSKPTPQTSSSGEVVLMQWGLNLPPRQIKHWWLHLVIDIDLCHSPKLPKKSMKLPILAFKVIEFGAIREPVYNFLSVINSNLCPISHRY